MRARATLYEDVALRLRSTNACVAQLIRHVIEHSGSRNDANKRLRRLFLPYSLSLILFGDDFVKEAAYEAIEAILERHLPRETCLETF